MPEASGPTTSLFSTQQQDALVTVMQVLYPHPGLDAGPYRRTRDLVLDHASRAPRLAHAVRALLTALAPALEDGDTRALLAALTELQDSSAFAAVRSQTCFHLYADHEVWAFVGYPGPAYDHGGYLHRGFNDLAWLPEPRVVESGAELVEVVDRAAAPSGREQA